MASSEKKPDFYDVIVVGGGNAALCAAVTAREEGAKVLLLERSPEDERGGNSSFTEGLMRFVYSGKEDIVALSPDLTPDEMASDFGVYTEEKFFDDMARITENRTDPDLCEILVKQSTATLHWMRRQGVRSFRSLVANHSRSTANSPSGAARRWRRSAVDAVSSTSFTARPRRPESRFATMPG